jgi:hypothetical protein
MRARITPAEQLVHSFQELLPFAACLLLFAAHWSQALVLLGLGDEAARWRPRGKLDPLPSAVVVGVVAGSAVMVLLFVEELGRCVRHSRATT